MEQEVGGGKGGGPSQTQVTYYYTADFAVALCEGPIAGVRRIWADAKLIYDVGDYASAAVLVQSQKKGIRFYVGDESQEPDPLIESYEGAGNVSAHRGVAYIVFDDLALESYGNRIPNITAEVVAPTSGKIEPPYNYMTWEPGIPVQQYYGAQASITYKDNLLVVGKVESGYWNVYRYDLSGNLVEKRSLVAVPPDGAYYYPFKNAPDEWMIYHTTADFYLYLYDPDGNSYALYAGSGAQAFVSYPKWYTIKGNLFVVVLYDTATFENYIALYDVSTRHLGGLYPVKISKVIPWEGGNRFGYALSPDGLFWVWGAVSGNTTGWMLVAYDEQLNVVHQVDATELPDNVKEGWSFAVIDKTQVWVPPAPSILAGIYDVTSYPWTKTSDLPGYGWTLLEETPFVLGTLGNNSSEWKTEFWVYDREQLVQTGASVGDVVVDICGKCGLAAAQVDVSAISKTTSGYVITRQMSGRSAIEPLMRAYWFDMVESDGKLKAVSRGGSPVASIPADDLSAHAYGNDVPDDVVITRTNELELPRRVSVLYMDKDKDYQAGEQHQQRIVTGAVNELTVELPIALTAQDAAQIADVLLYDAWATRERYSLSLPLEYVYLDPGDVVDVTKEGGVRLTLRIVKTSLEDCVLLVEGVREDVGVYSSNAVGGDLGTVSDQVDVVASTKLFMLDIPILRDNDDDPGYYAAATPLSDTLSWPGAVLYGSSDDESYSPISSFTTPGVCGYAVNALGDGPITIWDEGNVLTVELYSGSLYSATEAAVLNGANALLVGNEIIQFVDAYQNSDGTWTVSKLLRGRRGTDWATGSHVAGERVVVLASDKLIRVSMDSSALGQKRFYKAPTIGQNVSDAARTEFTNNGVGLKPYSPAHLKANYEGGGNWTITWVRRTRIAGEWRDYADVPLGEESEQYQVELWKAGVLDSQQTVTTATASISGAFDGDVVKVAQVSAIVGAGYYAEITLSSGAHDYRGTVMADNPVAYWRFGESSGSTAYDETGNNLDGTYSAAGITLGVAGLINDPNTAVQLDGGSNAQIKIPANSLLSMSGDMTIELWMKAGATQPSTYPMLVWKVAGAAANGNANYMLYLYNGYVIFRQTIGSTNVNVQSTTVVTDDVRHHIVGVRRGDTLEIWVDGNLEASTIVSGAPVTDDTTDLEFGYNSYNNGNQFTGVLDEAALYGVALTSARISEHYAVGTA